MAVGTRAEGPRGTERRAAAGSRLGAAGEHGGSTAVPVEVAVVERRSISSYIETNGTLEAENEVDLVARVSAPIVELLVEEGMTVRKGQTAGASGRGRYCAASWRSLRVGAERATLVYDRAKKLHGAELISPSSSTSRRSRRLGSGHGPARRSRSSWATPTSPRPFDGLIVARYVDFAEQLSVNTPLFRISDFDPLLCPIQVPERELANPAPEPCGPSAT